MDALYNKLKVNKIFSYFTQVYHKLIEKKFKKI